MKLNELIDEQQLVSDIENGYITARTYHGKTIYNYTPKTTYSGYWTSTTVQCRGLICDENNNIIARPFEKFFTLEQEQETYHLCDEEGSFESNFHPSFDETIIATDKLDGSLGILYDDNGEPALATRGRLDSNIALKFTNILRNNNDMYEAAKRLINEPLNCKTFLFELLESGEHVIQYPKDEIVLLGYVVNCSGLWHEACNTWTYWEYLGLPIAQRLPYNNLQEALEAPERENAEGMVVRFSKSGKLIKIKQESYMKMRQLHYNWEKSFKEIIQQSTFQEWNDYIENNNLLSFNFTNEMFVYFNVIEEKIEKVVPIINYMIMLWNNVYSECDYLSQKEYALKVLHDEQNVKYKSFLFAARKFKDINKLHPFDYIIYDLDK